ncbi:LOXL2 isoform 6, partial [Pan troglodytes]
MERPLCSHLCSCLAVLALLSPLSLAQYDSWPHYPEYFQQPAPEYHQPQAPANVAKIQLHLVLARRCQQQQSGHEWSEVLGNGAVPGALPPRRGGRGLPPGR